MQHYDLCANNATLDQSRKDFANQVLWSKLEEIESLYRRHGGRGNLYLGGSLGLRQPALLIGGHETGATTSGFKVKSDLDLFYLLPPSALTPAPAVNESAFLRAVAGLPDDLEVSVHVVPAVHVEEALYSTALDDLTKCLQRPLLQGFAFTPAPQRFLAKSMALLGVRMLGTAGSPYYVTTHPYTNFQENRLQQDAGIVAKTALSLLRLPCYELLGEDFSHVALLRLAEDGFFEGICTPQLVREIVRRREQVDLKDQTQLISLLELFRAVAARQLGMPSTAGTPELCSAFRDQYLSCSNRRDSLHALLLPLALWLEQPAHELWDQARAEVARDGFPHGGMDEELSQVLHYVIETRTPSRSQVVGAVVSLVHATIASISQGVADAVARARAKEESHAAQL